MIINNVKNKSLFTIMTIVVSAIVLFAYMAVPLHATSISELEKQDSELRKKLEGINEDILELNEEIETINMQVELTESEIARTQELLKASREEEEEQYENMKLRIRYMYEQGQTSMLEILLGAESLVDFINRSELINAVTEYDRDMLNSLVEVTETIQFEEENLIGQQESLVLLQETQEVKQAELEAQAQATSTDLAVVQNEIEAAKEAARIKAEKEAEQALKDEATSGGTSGSTSGSTSGGVYEGSSSDLDVFAAILDCEAYAQYDYMLAVATVIMNRVQSSRFPNSISGVIYQSGQFSPTWSGKLDRVLAQGASATAYKVAQDAMNGARLDKVSHCYYFLTASSTSRVGINVGGNLFFASW